MIHKKITGKYNSCELQFHNGGINYTELLDYLSSRKDFAPCFKDEAPLGHDLRPYTFTDLYDFILSISGGPGAPQWNISKGSYLFGVFSKDGRQTKYAVTIMGKPIGNPATVLSPIPVMTILFSDINNGMLRTGSFWSTFYEYRHLVYTGSDGNGWTWKCIETDRTDILGMQEKLKEILL
jgi:hypothetical protein